MNARRLTTIVAPALLALSLGGSSPARATTTYFGTYKVQVKNISHHLSTDWKVRWHCVDSNGHPINHIDTDTYPNDSTITRETKIQSSRCSTGLWEVRLMVKTRLTGWVGVPIEGGDFEPEARDEEFNSNKKLCIIAHSWESAVTWSAQADLAAC